MKFRFETLAPTKLIGISASMSILENGTSKLWQRFMPQRKEIKNAVGANLFSMQLYDASYSFKEFDPSKTFIKWAAMEVENFDFVPEGLQTYLLHGGEYVVFEHIGDASSGPQVFKYIFTQWFPSSEFEIDKREHFELLGEKYKNNDPLSEEEIWIPIRKKNKKSD